MDAQPQLPPELWEQTPPAAQELILAPAAALAPLQAEVAQLKLAVEELVQPLGRNSRHSSQLPSADPPQTTRTRRMPSGRRLGGQPGREGQSRALVPIKRVDIVTPIRSERCARCHFALHGKDGQPQQRQVAEIPSVKPRVTEYQLHRLVCPVCGELTRAEWPASVPDRGFGPRVQAITALCTGAYHLSRRTSQTVMEDLFGITILEMRNTWNMIEDDQVGSILQLDQPGGQRLRQVLECTVLERWPVPPSSPTRVFVELYPVAETELWLTASLYDNQEIQARGTS